MTVYILGSTSATWRTFFQRDMVRFGDKEIGGKVQHKNIVLKSMVYGITSLSFIKSGNK